MWAVDTWRSLEVKAHTRRFADVVRQAPIASEAAQEGVQRLGTGTGDSPNSSPLSSRRFERIRSSSLFNLAWEAYLPLSTKSLYLGPMLPHCLSYQVLAGLFRASDRGKRTLHERPGNTPARPSSRRWPVVACVNHHPEGSDIFPRDWLLASKSSNTGKPFLDDPEYSASSLTLRRSTDRDTRAMYCHRLTAAHPPMCPPSPRSSELKAIPTRQRCLFMVGVNCWLPCREARYHGKDLSLIEVPRIFSTFMAPWKIVWNLV